MSNLQREGVEVYMLQVPCGVVSPVIVSLWLVSYRSDLLLRSCSVLQAAQRSVPTFRRTHNYWSYDNLQPEETTCGLLASPKKGGESDDDDKVALDDDAKVVLGHHTFLIPSRC